MDESFTIAKIQIKDRSSARSLHSSNQQDDLGEQLPDTLKKNSNKINETMHLYSSLVTTKPLISQMCTPDTVIHDLAYTSK